MSYKTYPAASVSGMLQNYAFSIVRAHSRRAGRGLCFPGWVTVWANGLPEIQRSWRKSGRVKSVDVNVNPTRNSICIQRRRKLDYFVIGFIRSICLSLLFAPADLSFSQARLRDSRASHIVRRKRVGPLVCVLACMCVRIYIYVCICSCWSETNSLIDPKVGISAEDTVSLGRMGSFSCRRRRIIIH